jgi:Raf kinase inhibitor-like YbhB/YbcL family protein
MLPDMRMLVALLLLGACGGDGDAAIDASPGSDAAIDGSIDGPPGVTLALTSTAYADGAAIPSAQACLSRGGMDLSPPLAFANPPAGTLSYAVVFTDLSIGNGFVHSAIYDIPSTITSLPGDVDKTFAPTDVPGAHQTNNYTGSRGYAGPCPGTAHMYQLKLYALSTATVPGATMGTTKDQLVPLLSSNLGTATLTGTFTPP